MSSQTIAGTSRRTSASTGQRRLGLALFVIALAQLMITLDTAVVNVALPHVESALHFSGVGLEWVVTGYALTFGGLLLLGGRLGDIYGRRRIFITGIAVFTLASLAGGFATAEWWLLTARIIQGAGAALVAPSALSLIATTFPEGKPRDRAVGVYSAMSGGGAAIGLLVGGVLTTYVSWRWVLFVNVPIGVLLIGLASVVLAESSRLRTRFDIPGVVTSAGGLALLVYGLTHAAAGPDGISHWTAPATLVSLGAAAILLVSFVFIERRSSHPEIPLRIFASRARSGAYVAMLIVGTALFGVFFFMTLYIQTVWHYSALRGGVAWLAFPAVGITMTIMSSRVIGRIGARPLMLAGTSLVAGGFLWLSRLDPTGSYWTRMFGPVLVVGAGVGLLFLPITLTALSGVRDEESGAASGLLTTGQQVGGAVGLAAIGTIAWTSVAHSVASSLAAAGPGGQLTPAMYAHAVTVGFSDGFHIAAGVMGLGFLVALFAIRRQPKLAPEMAMRIVPPPTCEEAPC